VRRISPRRPIQVQGHYSAKVKISQVADAAGAGLGSTIVIDTPELIHVICGGTINAVKDVSKISP